MKSHQKKIVIGHPYLGRGGSEARVMWGLECLKENYDLTLITTCDVEWKELNECYGTSIEPGSVTVRLAPVPWFMRNKSYFAAWRGPLYERFCQQVAREYDLCISAYNFTNWGVPALHFIADFVWDEELKRMFDPAPTCGSRMIHRPGLIRYGYLSLGKLLRGSHRSHEDFFRDHREQIIVNSKWTGDIIAKKYARQGLQVLYPENNIHIDKMPWVDKALGFVSISRIAPEKRIECMIEILSRVRHSGFDIHYHVIGGLGSDPYSRMINNLCEQHGNWITLEGHKAGKEKSDLLSGHRFAIHGRPHEAFGISVAEFVKAGTIPFIPDTGGQVEIVPFPELQYSSIDDAVEKITRVLNDQRLQDGLRTKLEDRVGLFDIENFKKQFVKIVERALETRQ